MSEIRTLIVDDSSVMRKIVERALRQAGLDPLVVHEAGSGVEGIDVLKARQVDLILSDINMPAMNGLELLRAVKDRHGHLKVYMITAYSDESNRRQAEEYGCDDYFTKPIDFAVLKEKLAV